MNKMIRGVGMALLGYFFIAMMGICAKDLSGSVPVSTMVFAQFSISLLASLVAMKNVRLANFKSEHYGLLILRAAMGLGAMTSMLFAVQYIPAVDGMLLQNTSPLFVPLVMQIFLHKKSSKQVWLSVLLGFVGVILVLKPGHGLINTATLVGLLAGILSAISFVIVGFLKQTEPSNRIVFYVALVGTLASLPFVLVHGLPTEPEKLILLLGVGVFMYFAQYFVTHSFAYASSTVLAPFCYSAVVFTGLLGWMIWKHVPDNLSLMGMILVMIGGGVAIVLESATKKKSQEKNLPVNGQLVSLDKCKI